MKTKDPLRIDPSRTQNLRSALMRELKRRFGRLKAALLGRVTPLAANEAPELAKFREWLKTQFGRMGLTDKELWELYVTRGYEKGAARAFDQVKKPGAARREAARAGRSVDAPPEEVAAFYEGGKQEFLRSSFGRPVAVQRVQKLVEGAYERFDDLAEDTVDRMTKTLADGLAAGASPREIAKELADESDLSLSRASTIARTEIVRAHAEGQLQAMADMGVEEVGVAVEFTTADDDRVCPDCEALQGVVLKIDEASGVLPVHPNCRCAWLPANVGEDDDYQVRSKRGIDRAFDEAGVEDVEVSKDRPVSALNVLSDFLLNVFCPTGPGGGVDATCSPGGAPAAKEPAAEEPAKSEGPSTKKNRNKAAKPKVLPYREPPPSIAKSGQAAARPRGDESQTHVGDFAELLSQRLGFRNILPEGQRSHKPGEVAEKGSTIDTEYDHSGRAYELKTCNTTATEYRLKAKTSEKEGKIKYAKDHGLTPYVMVGVRDVQTNEIHYYTAKEPGMTGAAVSKDKFDYVGTVKYTKEEYDRFVRSRK